MDDELGKLESWTSPPHEQQYNAQYKAQCKTQHMYSTPPPQHVPVPMTCLIDVVREVHAFAPPTHRLWVAHHTLAHSCDVMLRYVMLLIAVCVKESFSLLLLLFLI